MVPNTKTLWINGVLVDQHDRDGDIRGHLAEATGVLHIFAIEAPEDDIPRASLPPGKYYSLINPETGMLAEARVIE